ncbi:MAG: DUF5615 family PIN-like protein [Solirubrobacterales bacterium]|nr:DUF5615 family PIN-like protein [Solirubrobacterales bacterium]
MAAGRLIVLDDGLPPSLAAELRARGRPATTVAELGLTSASDTDVLTAVAERGAILVALHDPRAPLTPTPVAVVVARTDAARHEVVHHHAKSIAAQRRGRRLYA